MSDEDDKTDSDPQQEFAHEEELREQAENEVLGGLDVEHCQRMRG